MDLEDWRRKEVAYQYAPMDLDAAYSNFTSSQENANSSENTTAGFYLMSPPSPPGRRLDDDSGEEEGETMTATLPEMLAKFQQELLQDEGRPGKKKKRVKKTLSKFLGKRYKVEEMVEEVRMAEKALNRPQPECTLKASVDLMQTSYFRKSLQQLSKVDLRGFQLHPNDPEFGPSIFTGETVDLGSSVDNVTKKMKKKKRSSGKKRARKQMKLPESGPTLECSPPQGPLLLKGTITNTTYESAVPAPIRNGNGKLSLSALPPTSTKRGRGRPRRDGVVPFPGESSSVRGRGRGRGRPPSAKQTLPLNNSFMSSPAPLPQQLPVTTGSSALEDLKMTLRLNQPSVGVAAEPEKLVCRIALNKY